MMLGLSLLTGLLPVLHGATGQDESADNVSSTAAKELKWWEKRRQRPDIVFPHNAHKEVLAARGDVCMACHPFSGIPPTDPEVLAKINTIANEPLEAICHECHVDDRSAPMACELCHPDTRKIRPADHGGNYAFFHGEAGRGDETACRQCHLALSYCTDCHLARDPAQRVLHPLGYRDRHGLEARLDAGTCSGCHTLSYCEDCHRGGRR